MLVVFVFYLLTSILYLSPIFYNPSLLLSRNNDLEQFFMPMIIYAKQNILNGTFPMWNEMYFAGMPFAADPQSGLFYPPNILFLILPISFTFILLIILHLIFAQFFTYLLLRELKLNNLASIISAVLYAMTGQMAGYIEAGHYGLIATWTWIPLVYFFTLKLSKKVNILSSLGLALSLAMIFFTHTSSFLIVSLSTFPLFIYLLYLSPKNYQLKAKFYILSAIFSFGFSAIGLIPQLLWQKDTTRYILLNKPELYPKWASKLEPMRLALFPWNSSFPTDKLIAIGIIVPVIAALGFLKIKKIYKIAVLIITINFYLILLGEASPFYKYFSQIDTLILIRVTTRSWYLAVLILVILFAYFINKLNKKAQILIGLLAITEIFAISFLYIQKPIPPMQKEYASEQVYQFLENNLDGHRVYCVNRCLKIKETAKISIETIDGYNTVQQTNFYKASWQLTGGFWDYYTLSIPPSGLYLHDQLMPDVEALAKYDSKYIISPYEINSDNLKLIDNFEDYLIYEIQIPTNRFYDENNNLINYQKISVNKYLVDVSEFKNSDIFFATVYSKGWRAYDEAGDKIAVNETPNALMALHNNNSDKIILYYMPVGMQTGLAITFFGLSFSAYLLSKSLRRK